MESFTSVDRVVTGERWEYETTKPLLGFTKSYIILKTVKLRLLNTKFFGLVNHPKEGNVILFQLLNLPFISVTGVEMGESSNQKNNFSTLKS